MVLPWNISAIRVSCFLYTFILFNVVAADLWEDDQIICPNECTCKYIHFLDLSIARWINQKKYHDGSRMFPAEDSVNNNEALFAGDDTFQRNPMIKFAMCFLQSDHHPKDLISVLPQDIQALVLMCSTLEKNTTVTTGDLNVLTELTTVEIRGPTTRNLQLVIDEPLASIQNVNFEFIQLSGHETFKRSSSSVHPSEIFDYVPDSEKVTYNVSVEIAVEDEVEILPYDVYIMEIKKSQMASFIGWNELAVLRIHNCRVEELHWEMFDGLVNLQHLSLENNEIKIVPAFTFYGAMHIQTLSLANNLILDMNYRSLAGLLDLEHLDLRHNSISKLSELTFPPMPKLRSIDFRHNPIKFVFPDTFGVMNKTEVMHFGSANVQLELMPTQPFKPLTHLKFLSIFNAFAEKLGQNIFMGLKSLEVFHLQGNISVIEFDAFVEMPNLRELRLSNCSLNEISMDAFVGCPNLKMIDLSGNNISYIPPGLFDEQHQLAEIYLQGNQLKYLPSNFFVNSNLKLARLNDNPWKCSCDMVAWDPNITNQRRMQSQQRCVREFHSGKLISCRTLDVYNFDNKLAPRCKNIKNRTVYYALRKDLKCISRKRVTKHLGTNTRPNQKHKLLAKKESRMRAKINNHSPISRKAKKRIINDIPKDKQLNSLKHLTLENNHAHAQQSNGILGSADSYESFNYI